VLSTDCICQGDIATCAGTYLHLWSVNGCEIANINTAVGRSQQILCVAMSQVCVTLSTKLLSDSLLYFDMTTLLV